MADKKKNLLIFIAITAILTAIEIVLITFVRNEIISQILLKDKSVWHILSPFSMRFVICTGVSWAISTGYAVYLFFTDKLLSLKDSKALKAVLLLILTVSVFIASVPFFTINKRTVISEKGISQYNSFGSIIKSADFEEAKSVSVQGRSFSYGKGVRQYFIDYQINFNGFKISVSTENGLWNINPYECILLIDAAIPKNTEKNCNIDFSVCAFTDNKELQSGLQRVFTARDG